MDFSRYNKKSLAARKAGVANEKPAVPDAIRPKPTPSMSTPSLSSPRSSSASTRAIVRAEAASLSKPNIKDSAIERVHLLDTQIQTHKREITGCNNKIKRIQAELDGIPQALWGHHRPQRERLEKGRQDCLKRIKAAEEGLLAQEKEKNELQPRTKAEEKIKKAAEQAAKAEQKKLERSKKLKAYHEEFNSYTGTARSSSSHSPASKRGVSEMTPKSAKTPKRKREGCLSGTDDIQPSKKVKGTPPSLDLTSQKLASLGRIPKKAKSPAEDQIEAIWAPKHQKRKRVVDGEAGEDMPAKRRNTAASQASPKPESTSKPIKTSPKLSSRPKERAASKTTPSTGVSSLSPAQTAGTAGLSDEASASTKKTATPPSPPDCEKHAVKTLIEARVGRHSH